MVWNVCKGFYESNRRIWCTPAWKLSYGLALLDKHFGFQVTISPHWIPFLLIPNQSKKLPRKTLICCLTLPLANLRKELSEQCLNFCERKYLHRSECLMQLLIMLEKMPTNSSINNIYTMGHIIQKFLAWQPTIHAEFKSRKLMTPVFWGYVAVDYMCTCPST